MHAVPIPARFPDIPAAARHAIETAVREIRAREPRLDDTLAFGPDVMIGISEGPAVLFGDTREIPLLAAKSATRFDYRLGWLAESSDTVVVSCPPCAAFETYQRAVLGQPGIRYLHIDAPDLRADKPSPVMCLRDGSCFDAIAELARRAGKLTIVAHIVTGTVWALAARLQQQTGVPVFVAGPPPRLSRAVNDKLWFGDFVRTILGDTATPEKRAAYSVAALTRHVSDLVPKWPRLVVKVPDSAGGVGQVLLATARLRGMSKRDLHGFLGQLVLTALPRRQFPLAVEVWDVNVIASPSVQIWVPARNGGDPVIEGIYEQLMADDELNFRGATCAMLSPAQDAALAQDAMKLALALQALGYFGRCSFDAVVTATPAAGPAIHWIECNGRWGGVSIPMSLLTRLGRGAQPPAHLILQDIGIRRRPMRFSEALERISGGRGGGPAGAPVILLSPEPVETGRGAHLLATGNTREDAFAAARDALDLLGA